MKMFTRDEIVAKVKEFDELFEQERKLMAEVLTLEIHGPRERVKANQARHDEILKEVEVIRMEKMLPILAEMLEFIAYCEKLEKEGKLPKKSEDR